MAINLKQAREARESCADVFTPEGDAGVIAELRQYGSGDAGVMAYVTGRLVGEWFPLSDLDTADTL